MLVIFFTVVSLVFCDAIWAGGEVSLSFSIAFFVSVTVGLLLIIFLFLSLIEGTLSSSFSVCFILSSSFCLDWNFSLKCLCTCSSIFVFLKVVYPHRFVSWLFATIKYMKKLKCVYFRLSSNNNSYLSELPSPVSGLCGTLGSY